ncbi:MAG: hypothetical protein WC496_08035 [Phycisphaerae bacterium]|jgi:Tfp pilus assembly protein PilX
MKIEMKNNGSILIVVVFAIALLTAFVVGMLQMNSEQIQIMKNEIFVAQATAIAHAGLADAFSQLRNNSSWNSGFNNKTFGSGRYTVTVVGSLPDPNIISTGTSAQGFVTKIEAEITIGSTNPYVIQVNNLRINQ